MFDTWSDDHFYIWLAGFFDGEGSIHVPREGITLTLAGTVEPVIAAIARRVGYGTLSRVEFVNQPHWKTKYLWRVRTIVEAHDLLIHLRPYLTIKADAADIALEKTRRVLAQREASAQLNGRICELALTLRQCDVARLLGVSRARVHSALHPRPPRRTAAHPNEWRISRQIQAKTKVQARTVTRTLHPEQE